MSQQFSSRALKNNAYEFSVSELAQSLKSTIEDTYGYVRVRGELGRVIIARSGHCYLDIRDDRAVINSIVWKGQMVRLGIRPEEGMEVVVEGKLSTYPGRSNYQLIIDKMEPAGEGALMALFERRRKALAAEGLFDPRDKRDLPFMPSVIGVVTSPTGAVIRDILHRIMDRFPLHVLVWPVSVQGNKAAEQVAGAITGFNQADGFTRPDVLIVARGGGSLEDLWCFNEEVVVRAAAGSNIPLVSAIGHETDWTLIDHVADYRAPTPTGAAERVVPVLSEWQDTIADHGVRIMRGLRRSLDEKQSSLSTSRLPGLESVLAGPQQRLDLASARMPAPMRLFEAKRQSLDLQRLPNPGHVIDMARQKLSSQRLRPDMVTQNLSRQSGQLQNLQKALLMQMEIQLDKTGARLGQAGDLLKAYSCQGVLSRGYVLVRDGEGRVIRSARTLVSGDPVTLTFADGDRPAVIDKTAEGPVTQPQPAQ
ncbi:MAG: exodeoxyribonuclease VII large subunit [Hyphomonadaceae bacterium]|nr:exodeoxyribonuclease VII large subunit [Hyphomonadaceae bacterium]MBC6411601.1 exodeoxyribonuclease VII large subunit [Hyphomonadaceae bacterium]